MDNNKVMIAIWAKTHEEAFDIFYSIRNKLYTKCNIIPDCSPYNFIIEGKNYKLRIFPDCSAKYGVIGHSFDYMYCFPDTAEYRSRLKQNGVFQQSVFYEKILDIIKNSNVRLELKPSLKTWGIDVGVYYPDIDLPCNVRPKLTKLRIKNVIFNDPATIVFWFDGTKTVVKCQEGETFDKEKGLAMAISKKMLGNNKSGSNFNEVFKKWCKE